MQIGLGGYATGTLIITTMDKVKKILQIVGYIITAILAGWGGSQISL